MPSVYFLNQIKNRIFTSKLLRFIMPSIPKKFRKIYDFFLYSVQGERCSGRRKFLADGRIFKYC
jgi:hypothetical protein